MVRSPNGNNSDTPGKKEARSKKPRNDCGADSASRANWQGGGDLPQGEHKSRAVFAVENEVQGGRCRGPEEFEAGSEGSQSGTRLIQEGKRASQDCTLRSVDRTSAVKKKRELGLHGDLRGRHLPGDVRRELLRAIDDACAQGETLSSVCRVLEVNARAVYRWRQSSFQSKHGGGGGLNKVTDREVDCVVKLAKKFPQFRCRRLGYQLERSGLVYIGKTKVAEILKAHGLNHSFERNRPKPDYPPADMLLHEPWRKNLLWGADWTWVTVAGRFMFLLLVLDWYSRKILAWGLFHQITSFEVVAVMTDAVAAEEIDLLREGEMHPRLVLDHGSANVSRYTRSNLEVQGLEIWLSGIGRPTGNARTERVIGTLKHEEIKLQPEYQCEDDARSRIDRAIRDYNFRRPNAGNGGFAPHLVHLRGRAPLVKRRALGRQKAKDMRLKHWKQMSQAALT